MRKALPCALGRMRLRIGPGHDVALGNVEIGLLSMLMVVLRIGDRRLEQLLERAHRRPSGCASESPLPHRPACCGSDPARSDTLLRGNTGVFQISPCFHAISLLSAAYLPVVFEPAWPLKVLVGANSPSLWPTISSVTYTGTCLRPSWTAKV